jgi:hypothetical protein
MIKSDIETYIHWRLSIEHGLVDIKPDVKREISETLANCHVESLGKSDLVFGYAGLGLVLMRKWRCSRFW